MLNVNKINYSNFKIIIAPSYFSIPIFIDLLSFVHKVKHTTRLNFNLDTSMNI